MLRIGGAKAAGQMRELTTTLDQTSHNPRTSNICLGVLHVPCQAARRVSTKTHLMTTLKATSYLKSTYLISTLNLPSTKSLDEL